MIRSASKKTIAFAAALLLAIALMTGTGSAKGTPPAPSARVKAIWDYKAELGLSAKQIGAMKGILRNFEKALIPLRASLQVSELNVQDLIRKNARMAAIKAQLEKSADIQVSMRIADVESARKIRAVLTPAQLQKWREIQTQARKKEKK